MINCIDRFDGDHYLIVGDLNSQNTLWGSRNTSHSGAIWEDFANELGLIILNDGSPTLFSTRNTLTSVDVSMASSDLAPSLFWATLYAP